MKTHSHFIVIVVATAFIIGCASDPPGAERGPHNTIAHNIAIESTLPGTKIEVNYKAVGIAPVTVKVFGDRDGTFHNFGSDEFIVRAYPPDPAEFPQTKIFKTGAMGVKDDRIPEKILFEFGPAKSNPR